MPPAGFKRSRALWDNARRPYANGWDSIRPWLRAVLYELQPVRSSELPAMRGVLDWLKRTFGSIARVAEKVPGLLYNFSSQRTRREMLFAVGALIYYITVRWIHHVLEAGPIVLIITALVGIFKIGLGENTDGISAYAVFNRGFQRLLGELDADELVAQQMGGGIINRGGRDARNDILEPPPPARQARAPENENDGESSSDDDDHNDNGNGGGNGENTNNPPGTRARRRNLEQRRELRHQREAAAAMGFGADEQAEAVAMQRLLDEQVDDVQRG